MSNLRRLPPSRSAMGTQQLLVWLGLPKTRIYPPSHTTNRIIKLSRIGRMGRSRRLSFWERDKWELVDLLTEATTLYRTRIKSIHPDKPNGSNEEAVALNLAIDRLRKLFMSRGITIDF